MIGLEYICKLFEKQFKDVAEIMRISPKTVNDWVRERRVIPKRHLPKLAEIFQLDEFYFQKELTTSEKLRLQRIKIDREAEFEKVEISYIDQQGEEVVEQFYYSENEMISNFLREEEEETKLIEDIAEMINEERNKAIFNMTIKVLKSNNNDIVILKEILEYLNDIDKWGLHEGMHISKIIPETFDKYRQTKNKG
ncbi:helix-turn-helix transcriptional regulator [Brevibacillus choshinensis]|uniref:helix-turn-helix domain-containing protein n=1 Tax=Brevibacillus choshinensis TaxID=54911 RepID=UPI002E235ED6|nr:helix-turn-helix transcriptional regulator [Brevibacillus choshinensis]